MTDREQEPAEGLSQRVQDAIQQHIDAHGSGMVTEFLLVANYVDSDGGSSFFLTVSPGQVLSTSLGLVRWAELSCEHDARRFLGDQLDDD